MGLKDTLFKANRLIADGTGSLTGLTKNLKLLIDEQKLNNFDIILYPHDFSFGSLSSVGTALMDTVICKLFVQSMNFELTGVEYERLNYKHNKAVGLGDISDVTIEFVENDLRFVSLYLENWLNEIVNLKTGIFRDNQNDSKKDAVVILSTGLNIPSPSYFKLTGLKLKSFGNLEVSQDNGEGMIVQATFTVDNIFIDSLYW